jgi:hypothetical protein
MGYNTVVLVLNDATDLIEQDQSFGSNLRSAIVESAARGKCRDIPAYSTNGRAVHVNAATVLSCAHADVPQIMLVKQNYGWNLWKEMPEGALGDLKALLHHHGYDVRKRPTK